MLRRKGTSSMPDELSLRETLSNKKEMTIRGDHPSCPVPMKLRKNLRNQTGVKKPTPLCFNNNVILSPMYNQDLDTSYFEQVFENFGIMGQGSFGTVFRVKNRQDAKLYAVKQLKSHICQSDRCAEVKNNELIGYNKNCVQYFMAWEENFDTFILLEYCEISLQDYSKVNRNLPEDLLWNVLYDICQALSFLHQMNYIHLDVKPGNIMMKRGHFKLGDFGLLVDLQMQNHVRKSTLSDGDSKYLALEVLDGIYTTSCDVFGLGISIFELSTDIELPDHGLLWHKLRHEILPFWFYECVSYRMSLIIEKMVISDYKQRPSVDKILTYWTLKEISKRDEKTARIDYAEPFVKSDDFYDTLPLSPINTDNNMMTTPPFNNNIRHSHVDYGYDSLYHGRDSDSENSPKFSGKKSLFCNSDLADVSMEDNKTNFLAQCLYDSGIESTNSDNGRVSANLTTNTFEKGSLITSTPVLAKTKHSKQIPKTKLTFD